MDWEQRRKDITDTISVSLEMDNLSDNHEVINKIITQEKSMLAKAEEEKKELIEAIAEICELYDNDMPIPIGKYVQLLQKYSEEK